MTKNKNKKETTNYIFVAISKHTPTQFHKSVDRQSRFLDKIYCPAHPLKQSIYIPSFQERSDSIEEYHPKELGLFNIITYTNHHWDSHSHSNNQIECSTIVSIQFPYRPSFTIQILFQVSHFINDHFKSALLFSLITDTWDIDEIYSVLKCPFWTHVYKRNSLPYHKAISSLCDLQNCYV